MVGVERIAAMRPDPPATPTKEPCIYTRSQGSFAMLLSTPIPYQSMSATQVPLYPCQ